MAVVIMLTGCGPAGGTPPGENNETNGTDEFTALELTVGGVTIDSSSSLSRVSVNLENGTKYITTVKINQAGEIGLAGDKLSFKVATDVFDPIDANHDGIYKLDIVATAGEQEVVYKVAYKVDTAKDMLTGHTFFIDDNISDNNFSQMVFEDNRLTITVFKDYEINEKLVYELSYTKKGFVMSKDGRGSEYNITFLEPLKIQYQPNGKIIELLDDKPKYIPPASHVVRTTSDDIDNHPDSNVPQIHYLEIAGNIPSSNGQAIVRKSVRGGKFSFSINSDSTLAQHIYSGLKQGFPDIDITVGYDSDDSFDFDCTYLGDDNGIEYTCNGVHVLNDDVDADGGLYVYSCDGDSKDADTKCSAASLPILFLN